MSFAFKNTIKKFLYHAGSIIVSAYSKMMFKVDAKRLSYIPRGAKIIVANHPTTTDPFILTSISKGQAAVLIKDILFDVPVFGKYLHLAGHIPVNKQSGKEAFEAALLKLKKGITVIIFIEGNVSNFLHKIEKPKTGAVRLAILSGKPIVPIGIGVREQNVRWIKSIIKGIEEWGKWYLKGPYALSVGKPIKFSGDITDRNKVRCLSNRLGQKISGLTKESTGRLESNAI